MGQSVLDGQEPEKVNMALAVWLIPEPHTVRSWGNSDSGLSQRADGGTALQRWAGLGWHWLGTDLVLPPS